VCVTPPYTRCVVYDRPQTVVLYTFETIFVDHILRAVHAIVDGILKDRKVSVGPVVWGPRYVYPLRISIFGKAGIHLYGYDT
jgi:hypothetical protein